MRVYWIRHGETDWNAALRMQGRTDIPLNENGEQKARELAARLASERERYPIDALYCSPLRRARKTAEILGAALHLQPQVRDGIQEINMGLYEGLTWKEAEEQFGEVYRQWDAHRLTAPPPGSDESYADVVVRARRTMRQAVCEADPSVRSIAIVSHGGVIRPIVLELTDGDKEHMEDLYIPNLTLLATDYNPVSDVWTYRGLER